MNGASDMEPRKFPINSENYPLNERENFSGTYLAFCHWVDRFQSRSYWLMPCFFIHIVLFTQVRSEDWQHASAAQNSFSMNLWVVPLHKYLILVGNKLCLTGKKIWGDMGTPFQTLTQICQSWCVFQDWLWKHLIAWILFWHILTSLHIMSNSIMITHGV